MRDSDKSEVIRDVEIRILKSKEFPEGGMAYIKRVPKSIPLPQWPCAEIERADDRDGSKALERYLNDKLTDINQKNWICGIPTIPGAFSRAIAGSAFGMYLFRREQGILNGDPTEETAQHSSFGTVLVKCLTFVEIGPDFFRPA